MVVPKPSCHLSPSLCQGKGGGAEMADELTLHLCEVWRWGFHGL